MARLDVHPLRVAGTSAYVVDVQADLLSYLATRVVVPLRPEATVPRPIRDLNPVCEIEGRRYVLVTQGIATIPRKELKTAIMSLLDRHDEITRSLDILLIGL